MEGSDDVSYQSFSDEVVVTTARLFVTVYLAIFALEWAGIIGNRVALELQLLFVITAVVGVIGVVVQHRSLVRTHVENLRSGFERHEAELTRIVSITTRNLVLILVVLYAITFTGFPVEFFVDLGLLYGLVVAFIATTLFMRRDRTAAITTRLVAVALVSLTLLAPLLSPLQSAIGPTFYILTGIFVVLTLWKGQSKNLKRDSVIGQFNSTTYWTVVLAITALAAIVIFYRLGELHLYEDEYQVVNAAAGYYHTGEFYSWDWVADEPTDSIYDRAWPHSLTIALSYEIFGISEWSSRLPSAIAGVLFVPIAYYVFEYFTERRLVALITSGSIVLYPSVTGLFRLTRMYAILIPLFLILTYLLFRSVTEGNSIDFRNERMNRFVNTWFDFNIVLGIVSLPLLYLGYLIHINALFVLPGVYLFVLFQLVATGERKYLTASVIGALGLLATAVIVKMTDRLGFLPFFVSFFDQDNTVYLEYLLEFPFELAAGVIFFFGGFLAVNLAANAAVRTKLTYLYIISAFSLVFLVYIGDRYASRAYMIHVVPIGVLLAVYGFAEFLSALDSRAIHALLIGLLLLNVVVPLHPAGPGDNDYESIYYEDSEDFTTAYGTIESNYDEDEVIIGLFIRDFYLKDLDGDASTNRIPRGYSMDQLEDNLSAADSGWITWETRKGYHIDSEVEEYVDENFEKYHGEGIDDTGVEVYYFDESMINATEQSG